MSQAQAARWPPALHLGAHRRAAAPASPHDATRIRAIELARGIAIALMILSHGINMREIATGTHRIQAGLPPGTAFAPKTGTQLERACNLGVIDPAQAV
jgi:beta-lactamase class A